MQKHNNASPIGRGGMDYDPKIATTEARQRNRLADFGSGNPASSQISPSPSSSRFNNDGMGPGGIDLTSPKGDLNMRNVAHELEVKIATESLDEIIAISKLVQKIEKEYASCKDGLNDHDLTTSESGILVQTLSTCLGLLEGIYEETQLQNAAPFDQRLSQDIRELVGRVRVTNQQYNEFKGEFYAVHDSVINKDMGLLKLNRVQRTLEKQEPLVKRLPMLEKDIHMQANDTKKMKQFYMEFERSVFNKKFDETASVIKMILDLVKKIQSQQINLSKACQQTKEQVSAVKPATKDQRQQQQKILSETVTIHHKIEASKEKLARELIDKNTVEENHHESAAIFKQLQKDPKLTQMAEQCKSFKQLADNNVKANDLLQKLQELDDADLDDLEYALQKQMEALKKFADTVDGDRRDELDDLLRKIGKLDKKVNQELDEVEDRLENFEGKINDPSAADGIPDSDLIFVKKEINRNRGAAQVVRGIANDNVADAQDIKEDIERRPNNDVEPEDVQALKGIAKSLQRQDEIDLPRLRKNLDQLEGFSLKALKNQMHEDNKKSQQQISQIKKTFEDLQKVIDKLNDKIASASGEINGLREGFTNEDLERENEVVRELVEKLEQCDDEVNADNEMTESGIDLTHEQSCEFTQSLMARQNTGNPPSLQMRKKFIIKDINENVQLFNENNKAVREANKVPKTEREVAELIQRNKGIQRQAAQIEEKILAAKVYAEQIEKRIDGLTEPLISQLRAKYIKKNKTIDECDELFDKCQKFIDDNSKKADDCMKEILDVIDKLEAVSPLAHPSAYSSIGNQKKQAFMKKVQEKLDRAHKLRDKTEDVKNQLIAASDDLNFIVEPLNQIGEREVKQPEIDQVLAKEKNLFKELQAIAAALEPLDPEIQKLSAEVDDMIDDDKTSQILLGEDRINDIDKLINELEDRRQKCHDKLDTLRDLIREAAKEIDGKFAADWDKAFEKELKELDAKMNDLKRKRGDMRKTLDEVKNDPSKYSPSQIEALLGGFEEQVEKAANLNDKYDDLEERIDARIEELKDMLGRAQEIRNLKKLADDFKKQLKHDIQTVQEQIDELPREIAILRGTLNEMKKESEPKGADYWDERQNVRGDLDTLDDVEHALKQLKKEFDAAKDKNSQIEANVKRITLDVEALRAEVTKYDQLAESMKKMIEDTEDERIKVTDVQKRMDDCMIPVNVQRRRVELEAFSEEFRAVQAEIDDMLNADGAYSGSSKDDSDIAEMIKEIRPEVEKIKRDEADAYKYLQMNLESWPLPDCLVIEKQQKMIELVSKFRETIDALKARLHKLQDKANALNAALVQQNMDNALGLFEKRADKLRQRALAVRDIFRKIKKAGEDMDGNHTDDENDFVEALQEEMPAVEEEMKNTLAKIDYIDQLIDRLKKDRDVETMGVLKSEVDQATRNVEEKEHLAAKLEPEIVQWDPLGKLIRRDEELDFVEQECLNFQEQLKEEEKFVDRESQRLEERKKGADSKDAEVARKLLEQVMDMLNDIEELQGDIDSLSQDQKDVNNRFQPVLPVKVRQAKALKEGKTKKKDYDDPSMNEIYDYVSISCGYRPEIKKLAARCEGLQSKMLDFQDKYSKLKDKCGQKPKTQAGDYIADKKDPVDVMFAEALRRSDYRGQIKIVRLGPGKYMFGTKKIMAKIINGKLVIRVGGGYMNVDEFIEQYGRMEVVKALAEEERKQGVKFADDAEYECNEAHAGQDGGLHTHKASHRNTVSGGAAKSVKNAMKRADQYIAQENVKHHIEDALYDAFAQGEGTASAKRSQAINLEIAKMGVGSELTLTGRKTVNITSPNNIRAALAGRVGASPRGAPKLAVGSPKSGSIKKLTSPTNASSAARHGGASPIGTGSARRGTK